MANGVSRLALRLLLLPLLVLGVVAMHQLPVADEAHPAPATSSTTVLAHEAPAHGHAGGHGCCGDDGAGSAAGMMLHMCLAIIAAGLALAGLHRRWSMAIPRPALNRLPRAPSDTSPKAPPWVFPTVYALRVLRL